MLGGEASTSSGETYLIRFLLRFLFFLSAVQGNYAGGDWFVNEKVLREVLQNLPERAARDKHSHGTTPA